VPADGSPLLLTSVTALAILTSHARVAELAYALDLGSSPQRMGVSSRTHDQLLSESIIKPLTEPDLQISRIRLLRTTSSPSVE